MGLCRIYQEGGGGGGEGGREGEGAGGILEGFFH